MNSEAGPAVVRQDGTSVFARLRRDKMARLKMRKWEAKAEQRTDAGELNKERR